MTQKGGSEEDIKSRLGKARTALNELRNVWKSSQLKLNTKLKIFKSTVVAVLPYGCETWRMTKNDVPKLDVCLHKNLRRLMDIYWLMYPMKRYVTGVTSAPSASKSTGGAGGSSATSSKWTATNTPRQH